MTSLTFGLVFAIGALIGTVGIGGFLVVPVLVFIEGRSVRDAVIAATVSFAGAGLVSLFVALRQGRISSGRSRSFLMTTAPGALLGALLLRVISSATIGIIIAVVVGLAGLSELWGIPRSSRQLSSSILAAFNGAITGVGSALTGTSGPIIGMPLLAWAGTPIVERIRIGQVAQLPIAVTAAIVFIMAGDIAWTVAVLSAFAIGAGVLIGMQLTTVFPPVILSRTSAALMLLTACCMLGSSFFL